MIEFVRNQLVNDWQPFVLTDPTGMKLSEESSTVAELKLVSCVFSAFTFLFF